MTEETKICKDCGIEYPKTREFFYYAGSDKRYLRSSCKGCASKRAIKPWEGNKEKVREQQAEYYQNNREKRLQKQKEYYQKNKERILEYQKHYSSPPEVKKMICERVKKRRNENPSYKIQTNVSRLVRMYLHKNGGEKNVRLWNVLPYTPKELREHLESQFEDWMTWENYGNGEGFWNIDHIIPQSKLPYDSLEHPNFLKSWGLSNLRPLCAIENCMKRDKIISD